MIEIIDIALAGASLIVVIGLLADERTHKTRRAPTARPPVYPPEPGLSFDGETWRSGYDDELGHE